jgi:hypothetical protein
MCVKLLLTCGQRLEIRLRIRKTKSGTYYIASLPMRKLRASREDPRRFWTLTADESLLVMETKPKV